MDDKFAILLQSFVLQSLACAEAFASVAVPAFRQLGRDLRAEMERRHRP